MRRARYALISVHEKRGLAEFARGLTELEIAVISTGGTADYLRKKGLPVIEVEELTGVPEMLGGRVKTLHPRIHAGILASRASEAHRLEMERQGWDYIDIVVVNMPTPLVDADENLFEYMEGMDIGGHALLRAAAKNCRDVIAICNPSRYGLVLDELRRGGGVVSDGLRIRLAREAMDVLERYDGIYSARLAESLSPGAGAMPPEIRLRAAKVEDLRYGENPHQRGAVYRDAACDEPSVLDGCLLNGKQLSYNNYLDLDAGLALVKEFEKPACTIIKHANPCGVAIGQSAAEAYRRALATDPQSAFGGVVAFNADVDLEAAEGIASIFTECLIAPSFTEEAIARLREKKNLRVLELPSLSIWLGRGARRSAGHEIRSITGGFLMQDRDFGSIGLGDLKPVTRLKPSATDAGAIFFAWAVVKHVRSNAVVIASGEETVGIGAGQMSRVDAARLAVRKARKRTEGCVAASDGFFPFRDAVEELARAGVRTIVQPGGSRMDDDLIAACDEIGVAMVFTGMRCFKH